jgi:serine protease Do
VSGSNCNFKKEQQNMKSRIKSLRPFLLVVFGVVFGVGIVVGFGGMSKLNIAFGQGDTPTLGGPIPNIPDGQMLQNMNASFRALAKAIQPTVVSIRVKSEMPKKSTSKNQDQGDQQMNPFHFFFHSPGNGNDDDDDGSGSPFDFGQRGPREGLGSGVIISSDGYILTNNHVVADAAKKGGVTVKLSDKRTYDGRVIGTDPTTDLAVVKIDATGLPAAAFGNSDDVQVGDWVIAVGNPLGLESTVTKGIVSSLGRQLDLPAEGAARGTSIADFIQTDAAINPGNSGGGMFNVRGQVVGINSAIATQTGTFTGYGFAIPINLAKVVAVDLIKNGKVNRGYIGVNIRGVDATEAEALGLGAPRGVRIDNVVKGGAGETAGLQKNDIILSVDGQEVNESNQLQGMIAIHHAGDYVKLHVWRNGKENDFNVKLKPRTDDLATNDSRRDDDNSKAEPTSSKETATLENIGVSVRNLSNAEKDKNNTDGGVYITSVEPGSIAYERGLGAIGKVVTDVGSKHIKNAADFEKAINAAAGKKAVALTVLDDKGNSTLVAIKVPTE